jgi:hypothetical protein
MVAFLLDVLRTTVYPPTKFGGTPNLTRETRVLPLFQPRHISPVHVVHERQQLALALQFEIGLPS